MKSLSCRRRSASFLFVMLRFFLSLARSSTAWVAPTLISTRAAKRIPFHSSNMRLYSSNNNDLQVDNEGRRIRRRSSPPPSSTDTNNSWDDFEPSTFVSNSSSGGGWDDFDPMDSSQTQQQDRPRKSNPIQRDSGNRRSRERDGQRRHGDNRRSFRQRDHKNKKKDDRKINLKALEGAGFVHLYGLSSVLNALKADTRDFTRPESYIDLEMLQGEDLEHELKQRQRKPEAQFSPWLFVQEKNTSKRSADKQLAAQQVEELAEQRGVPIARVDKGVLNTLSGNRPHQGYVLRCGALEFEPLSNIPHPNEEEDAPKLWLVLDEVVDPQNLGALLRSAFFMGGNDIGVLVCSKNSAPPSPVVSAASAGALEVTRVWSTSNLPRTLSQAQADGFRIVGASSSVPPGQEAQVYTLNELPKDDRPTLLVLGSEGSGLRTLVARACTEFVQIPGAATTTDEADASGVDSLNVSVTGGILLWHLLQEQQR